MATNPPILHSFKSTDAVVIAVAAFIARLQTEAIHKKGKFSLAISGGSMPKLLRGLITRTDIKWDKWQVYFSDERVVPLDHEDSNYANCKKELFSKVPLPAENIHTINVDLLDDLEELTDDYESVLIKAFASKDAARFPVFDLILLGMGPDGHTCSLFPGHPLLSEASRWVVSIEDSPKPPARRITLTYPVINHAARVAFIATGEAKKEILATVLDHPEEGLPSSRVRPVTKDGRVYWFVDDAASQNTEFPRAEFKL